MAVDQSNLSEPHKYQYQINIKSSVCNMIISKLCYTLAESVNEMELYRKQTSFESVEKFESKVRSKGK